MVRTSRPFEPPGADNNLWAADELIQGRAEADSDAPINLTEEEYAKNLDELEEEYEEEGKLPEYSQ